LRWILTYYTKPSGASKVPVRLALACAAFAGAMAMSSEASANLYVSGYNAAVRVLPLAQQMAKSPTGLVTAGRFAKNQFAPFDPHYTAPQFRTKTTTSYYNAPRSSRR
jgi:hypothetical protein